MRTTLLLAALGALVAANDSSCGGDRPSKVSDCQNTDMGSCGNACCMVDFVVPTAPETTYKAIKAALVAGGGDGSYSYSHAADTAGHNPSDDLTPYGLAWK